MAANRTSNSTRNIFWGVVNKVCTLFFPFLVRTIMIQVLGAEYLGLSSLFTSVLQVLSLAELGVSSAIVYWMYKPLAEGDNDTVCAVYNLYKKIYRIIGTVILCLGIILLPFLQNLIHGSVPTDLNIYMLFLIYLSNTVISYYMSAYKECLLVANQRSDISTNIVTIASIGMYILQIVILIQSRNYYAYLILSLIATIVINIARSVIVDRMYPHITCRGKLPKELLGEIKKKVLGLMLYKISAVSRNSFDSIILSAFLGLVVLAKYQNYYYIMNAIIGFCSIVSTSITASVGNSIASETIEKNHEDFKSITVLYIWFAGWCTVCLLCLYQPFMRLWMGERYLLSFTIVILFCIYFFTLILADMCYIYRQAAGLWWEDKFRPVVETIVNLGLNILLVRYIGVAGVLISTIISIVFINLPWASYVLYKAYFKMPVREYWINILSKSVVVVIACGVTYTICQLFNLDGISEVAVNLVVCIIVPNIIFLLCFSRMPGFKRAMRFVNNMLSIV